MDSEDRGIREGKSQECGGLVIGTKTVVPEFKWCDSIVSSDAI